MLWGKQFKMWNPFKNKSKKVVVHPNGELLLNHSYTVGAYNEKTKYKPITVEEILGNVKRKYYQNIFIISFFNGSYYPVFDIDDISKYNDFCTNTTHKYVSFQSSPGHHWVIVDRPFETFFEFMQTDDLYTDWMVYSDNDYTNMCLHISRFNLRAMFESLNKQPFIVHKSQDLSKDFTEYIKKLDNHYATDSLEISTLKYKDPKMLNILKRIKKLERINEQKS